MFNYFKSEEGEQYALEKGAMFYETSAKTGKMVTDVLEQLARLMLSVVEKSERKGNK